MTTWTPATDQSETWTEETSQDERTFSPAVFSIAPTFDTGTTAGLWTAQTEQAEVWTNN